MAGSRDPLRDLPEGAPPRDLAVAPTRVGTGRSGRRAGLALASIAGAIALALALAQVAGPPPARPQDAGQPLAGSPSVAGIAPGTPMPTPVPAGVAASRAEGTPPRLGRDALRDRVIDGSLDGRLVFVDAVLDVRPAPCERPAQGVEGCVDLAIGGLGLPVRAGAVAIPWRNDPPPGSWLVTVARAGGLVYLGSLVPDPTVPESVADLANRLRRGDAPASAATLFEVPGWLVVDPPHPCVRAGAVATPCPAPSPFLAADEPSADGILRSSRGGEVALAAPVVDVERGATVTPGTFLLAPPEGCQPARALGTCRLGAAWLVVARYEPSRSVRVLVP